MSAWSSVGGHSQRAVSSLATTLVTVMRDLHHLPGPAKQYLICHPSMHRIDEFVIRLAAMLYLDQLSEDLGRPFDTLIPKHPHPRLPPLQRKPTYLTL